MDSLVHDVRNPLNALSINLDVLTEKLRREQGEIPAAQEKNLKVMREQIFRVDAILKHFAEFMAPRPDAGGDAFIDASDAVKQALSVLGHESRRAMIKVRNMVEPDLRVPGRGSTVKFLAVQAVFRAVLRAGQDGEVDVTFQRDGQRAVLRVKDSCTDPGREPFAHAHTALATLTSELHGELRINGAELQVLLPLV